MQAEDSDLGTPLHFDKLCEHDKDAYRKLQQGFNQNFNQRNNRRQLAVIKQSFEEIASFTGSDKVRGLVCGYYVCKDKILVNSRQMKFLLGCCKTQVNFMLKNAGYETLALRPKMTEMHDIFGIDENDPTLKQWSFRKICSSSTQPPSPTQLPKIVQSQSFTISTDSTADSSFWPYKVTPQVDYLEENSDDEQASLDPYDTKPVEDVEVNMPDQNELRDYDPYEQLNYDYYYDQYEPDNFTNLCEIDL